MTVRIVKVIFCDEERRGTGTEANMVRRIPTLYTLDGRFVCEYDLGPTEKDAKGTVDFKNLSGLA